MLDKKKKEKSFIKLNIFLKNKEISLFLTSKIGSFMLFKLDQVCYPKTYSIDSYIFLYII